MRLAEEEGGGQNIQRHFDSMRRKYSELKNELWEVRTKASHSRDVPDEEDSDRSRSGQAGSRSEEGSDESFSS